MTLQSTPVYIDDREPDIDKYQKSLRRRNLSSRRKRLQLGDFSWTISETTDGSTYRVIVERKTSSDLVNSLKDGRLGKFVDHEPQENEIRILLHERTDRKMNYGGFKFSDPGIDNVLLECQMRGIHVVSCQSGEVPARISSLWNWTMKNQHRSIVKPKLPSVSKGYLTGEGDRERKQAVQFLMGIPGLGEVSVLQLLGHLKNPMAVLIPASRRDYERFKGIPGIGKQRIDSIADFLMRNV